MSGARNQDSCRIALESEVCVDVSAIPAFRRRELAQCVLASVKQAMLQPGAEEEFQAWLAEYRKEKRRKPQNERS